MAYIAKSAAVQRLSGQFPTPANRETFWASRVSPRHNREIRRSRCGQQISQLLPWRRKNDGTRLDWFIFCFSTAILSAALKTQGQFTGELIKRRCDVQAACSSLGSFVGCKNHLLPVECQLAVAQMRDRSRAGDIAFDTEHSKWIPRGTTNSRKGSSRASRSSFRTWRAKRESILRTRRPA